VIAAGAAYDGRYTIASVTATVITLTTSTGATSDTRTAALTNPASIGNPSGTNDLELESSHNATGDVGLEAADSIYLTETRGTLRLALAEALAGDIRITVRETATTTTAADISTGSFTGTVTFTGTMITRTSGSFDTDGFEANTTLRVTGGTPYDGWYTIASVGALALTLTSNFGPTLGVASDTRSGVTLTGFGSLDEDRRSAVVDLLRSLADRFPQVILITHIDSVREGFDRVIRVGLDVSRGVATVRDEPVGGQDVAA